MSDRRKPIMKLSYNFRVRTPTELFFPNITMYGYVHILTFSYIKTVKERTHINNQIIWKPVSNRSKLGLRSYESRNYN